VLLVEWALRPREDGRTDLHLLETGFTEPDSHRENTSGWDEDLPILVRHLDEAS